MQPMLRPTSSNRSLVDRMIGVTKLDNATLSSIRLDVDATSQALIVVALAAVAAGIGAIGHDQPGIIWQIIKAIGGWAIFSVIAFFIGTLFTSRSQRVTLGQVLRLIGFAQAPKIIGALAVIPLVGWIAGFAAAIWFLVVAIAALREAFGVSTGVATIIGVLSLAAVFVVNVVVATIFNIAGGLVGWLF
ncbi:MAG: YIP1 family protein [Thermomicrobiales bacterium]